MTNCRRKNSILTSHYVPHRFTFIVYKYFQNLIKSNFLKVLYTMHKRSNRIPIEYSAKNLPTSLSFFFSQHPYTDSIQNTCSFVWFTKPVALRSLFSETTTAAYTSETTTHSQTRRCCTSMIHTLKRRLFENKFQSVHKNTNSHETQCAHNNDDAVERQGQHCVCLCDVCVCV